MSLAKKNEDEMASVKEVGNTSDNYGEREDTLKLIACLNTIIKDIEKIKWGN